MKFVESLAYTEMGERVHGKIQESEEILYDMDFQNIKSTLRKIQ